MHGLASCFGVAWEPRNQSRSDNEAAPTPSPNWLRDFLTEDVTNARIMIFNHNTSYQAYALSKSLHDYGKDLLRQLRNVRLEEEVRQDSLDAILIMFMGAYAAQQKKRPIIFIGHGLGGLIIKQVGLQLLDFVNVSLT